MARGAGTASLGQGGCDEREPRAAPALGEQLCRGVFGGDGGGERGWWVMRAAEQLLITQWGAILPFPSAPSLASLLVTHLAVGQLQQPLSLPKRAGAPSAPCIPGGGLTHQS